MERSRRIVLARRPQGTPRPDDFRLEEVARPAPGDGQMLVRNRVLAIEPRHFGALAGMAAILGASGKDELAMRAWEQFLDIYPADRKAQEQLGELAEKLAGSKT